MNEEDAHIFVDPIAVESVISASGDVADYALLTSIHALVVRGGFEEDSAVRQHDDGCLCKCGHINETMKLFGWMIEYSYSWNAMIA